MSHQHQWATTALWLSPTQLAAPCVEPGCATAAIIADGTFPLAVCGVPLDLRDVEGSGAIVKLACWEATHVYQLDTIPLQAGDLVLDIGAHVGTVSCYFAKARPDVRVVAVEPGDAQWVLLMQNLHANTPPGPPQHQNHAYHLAVTGDGRAITLEVNESNSGAGHIYGNVIPDRESVTLSAILWQHGPRAALLKIDCEGAEHEVLTDDVLDRVDFLVGEFHHAPARGNDAHALLARVVAKLGAEKVRVTVVGA